MYSRYNRNNEDLVRDAVAAKQAGFSSYGKMKVEEYMLKHPGSVQRDAAIARSNGYKSVRERMAEANKA